MELYLKCLPYKLDLMSKCSEKDSSERDPRRVEAKTVSQHLLLHILQKCHCSINHCYAESHILFQVTLLLHVN